MTRRRREHELAPAAPTHGLPLGALPLTVCFRSHDLPHSSARVLAIARVEGLRRGQSRAHVLVNGAGHDLFLPRRAERIGRGPLRARRRTVLIASMATGVFLGASQ